MTETEVGPQEVKTQEAEVKEVESVKKTPNNSPEAVAAFKEIQQNLLVSVVEQHNALISEKKELLDTEINVIMSTETIEWYHEKYALMAPPDVDLKPKFIIGHKICVNDAIPFKQTLVVYPLR